MQKTEFLKKNKLAMASLLIFIGVYLFVFIMNLSNIMDFGKSYNEAVNLTSYADTNVFLFYNDILCQNIQRIDLEGLNEADGRAYFNERLPILREIYTGSFISCSIIYTFLAFLFLQYFLFKKNEFCAKKHYRDVVLGHALCCTVYIGIVFFTLLSKGFVMTLHTPNIILILVCQFMVMLSASAVYAWIIRRIRFKKIAVGMLIILSIIFYFSGIILEINLSYPQTVESFDYVYEIDDRFRNEDYEEIQYYDPQTGQVIVGDDVYDPEYVPNPKYIGGIKRVALIGLEILNPLANMNRFGFDLEGATAVWITLLYMLKSIAMLALIGYSFSKEEN